MNNQVKFPFEVFMGTYAEGTRSIHTPKTPALYFKGCWVSVPVKK